MKKLPELRKYIKTHHDNDLCEISEAEDFETDINRYYDEKMSELQEEMMSIQHSLEEEMSEVERLRKKLKDLNNKPVAFGG